MKINIKTIEKLSKLQELLSDASSLLVVLQDHPDPDAVASGVALRLLANRCGVTVSIAHGGMVGRSENRALVNYLGINLRKIDDLNPSSFDLIALVDTQPKTGNNQLPVEIRPDIVFDHHPRHPASRGLLFTDIRSNYGSTSTILCEYLLASGIEPDPPMATALLYGLLSDTSELCRGTSRPDIEAHLWLSTHANLKMLSQIRKSPLGSDYFALLYQALANARVYNDRIFVDIGQGENPDMPGEIADLLLRKEHVSWCLCLIRTARRIIISLRGNDQDQDAGELIRKIVSRFGTGGGHFTYAGGQVPIEGKSPAEVNLVIRKIRDRYLATTNKNTGCRGRKLVPKKNN